MKPTRPRVSLAILDIDGTLIDSNDAHARAFDKAFREQGKVFPYENIRRLIGMGGDQLIPTLSGIYADSEVGKKIAKRKSEIFMESEMPNLLPFPQAKEFVQALVDNDIKVTIASSASESELEKFEKIIGIESLITKSTTSDDVESSKPEPDVVKKILEKMNAEPEEALMVGDTPYDIEAAAKAGVETVIVRCGGYWSEDDFKNALAVYDSPAGILKYLNESPFMTMEQHQA